MSNKAEDIHKMLVGTFETPLGGKCLQHLVETFIDRPMYKAGSTLEETAYRQGQADLVKQIVKEINNGR